MRLEEYAMLDATALGRLVKAGELSVAELVGLARAAYDTLNPTLNAILEFYDDAESVCGAEGGVFRLGPAARRESIFDFPRGRTGGLEVAPARPCPGSAGLGPREGLKGVKSLAGEADPGRTAG